MAQESNIPEFITAERPHGLGFPAGCVARVLKNPSETNEIKHRDLTLQILVKHEPNWTDLVIRQLAPGNPINFACRVFDNASGTPLNQQSPLQVLKSFIERVGLTLKIGTFEGKLLLGENIPISVSDATNLVQVENPADHAFYVSSFIRINKTEVGDTADVAMAFAVDFNEYDDWHN